VVAGWAEDGGPWVNPEAHEGTAAERAAETAALLAGETDDAPPFPLERVAERPSGAPGQDSAEAHCLGCGKHAGGRRHQGFSAHGSAAHVEERARAHTAETGHPTRVYGVRPVTEFYIPAA
jgi:hypothetical protein